MEWYLWVLSIYLLLCILSYVPLKITNTKSYSHKIIKEYWWAIFIQPYGIVIIIIAYSKTNKKEN